MRRAQDRARSVRSRKNGARSATIKSRALGLLKLFLFVKKGHKHVFFYSVSSKHLSPYNQKKFSNKSCRAGNFPQNCIHIKATNGKKCNILESTAPISTFFFKSIERAEIIIIVIFSNNNFQHLQVKNAFKNFSIVFLVILMLPSKHFLVIYIKNDHLQKKSIFH